MEERTNIVTIKGNPLTLLGPELTVGSAVPDFEVLDSDLHSVGLSAMKGSVCVILSVPSLDTSVCDIEARRFSREVSDLASQVNIVLISVDLPFAQKRWCGASGTKNVTALSDHRDVSFGKAFGVLIKELRLLARAVFVIDEQGVLQYRQIVSETTDEPDYAAALDAIRKLTGVQA